MPSRHSIALLLAMYALGFPLRNINAQNTTSASAPAQPSQQEIEKLIQQLGDKDFPTRDAADKKLRALGWRAMSYMIAGRPLATDEEAKSRLTSIMEALCWNTDDLPAKSAKVIADYRTPTTNAHRMAEVGFMSDANAAAVVFRSQSILGSDRWPTVVGSRISDQSHGHTERMAQLRRLGSWEELEWELLSCSQLSDLLFILKERPADAPPLLAALQTLRPKRPNSSDPLDCFLVAITLAKGDTDQAFNLSKELRLAPYQEMILAEKQDWTALAKIPGAAGAGGKMFLGDVAGADELLEKEINRSFIPISQPNSQFCDIPKSVALLGRIGLLNAGCTLYPSNDRQVEALLLERRYREALALHSDTSAQLKKEPALTVGGGDGSFSSGPTYLMNAQLDARLVCALAKLNEPERAIAEIKRLDAMGEVPYFLDEADRLLGRPESVKSRFLKSDPKAYNWPYRAAKVLAPKDQQDLAFFLFQQTNDVGQVTQQLVRIQQVGITPEDIRAAVDPIIKTTRFPSQDPASAAIGAAFLAARSGFNDLANEYLQKAFGPPSTGFGMAPAFGRISLQGESALEMFAYKKDFPQQFFDKLLALPECDPSLRYLAGLYEERHGNPQAGNAIRREGNLQLAGNCYARLNLARTLLDLNEVDLAKEQLNIILAVDSPVSDSLHGRNDAHTLLAGFDQQAGRFKEALQHYRLAYCASVTEAHLVGEPFDKALKFARNTKYCEARVAIDSSNRAAAVQCATDLMMIDPEGLDLTISLITAFKQAHFDAQAASLASINRQLLENIVKDFPNSHLHHFLIAKLDIESGFTNDQTQSHLRKARELAPANAEYQDLK